MAARSRTLTLNPVPPRSAWRHDLAAGLLFAAGLLVAACIFPHVPADPPRPSARPANSRPANLLGEAGALLSHDLLSALGLAAHVLLACWFVLVILLFLRQ